MTLKPIIFEKILFGEFAPWRNDNSSERKFRDILNCDLRIHKNNPEQFFKALTDIYRDSCYDFQLEFLHKDVKTAKSANSAKSANLQTDFSLLTIPPFYNKPSEFYCYLIDNECARLKTSIITIVEYPKKYSYPEYEVTDLLKYLHYFMKEVALKTQDDDLSVYVLTALKISLFRLYEEIKESLSTYTRGEDLSENEVIYILDKNYKTNKHIPETFAYIVSQFLISREKKFIPAINNNVYQEKEIETKIEKEIENEKSTFIPKKSDFRQASKNKITYDDILNTELFARVEEQLFNYDFIDHNYNFTNKHNKKKELAVIYKILIQKRYFRDKSFKQPDGFSNADYRQYLDSRYNVDTSQQFRRCTPEEIASVTDQYHWLDTLPACR